MKLNRRAMLANALVSAAACVTLNLWSAHAFGQAPGGSGPGPAAQPARGARLFTADPRAQVRTYHLDGANIDVPYCVFVSSKVSRSKPAPLIISLHGLGAGPQIMCNTTAIDLAEQGGYILAAPMGYSISGWYGSPVIHMNARRGPPGAAQAPAAGPGSGPTGPSDQDIQKWSEADVINVLAMMRKEFKVDPKRIYLTGHSMGGAGTLFLASKHADIWAAAAPVAPASFMMNANRADILKGIKDGGVPLLIVQGDADTVVAPSNTRLWAATAKELGMDFQYVELPGIDHGPVITASQKDVYAFFGKHARQ
ncbi:MAG TPA: prolyl oligopeptidase family serine peptidase [Steroidobacteraceae bacterium]